MVLLTFIKFSDIIASTNTLFYKKIMVKKTVIIFLASFVVIAVFLNIQATFSWGSYFIQKLFGANQSLAKTDPLPTSSLVIINADSPTPMPSMPVLATLSIPSLNVKAPIIFAKTNNESELEKDLEQGVVAYPGSAYPGQPGTLAISGHSSSYPWYKGQYGHIFSLLDTLQPGDQISITADGQTFLYAVQKQIIASPASIQFDQIKNYNLILFSCWPVGTNADRIAIAANLISQKQ